ncbi:DUF1592 domain-containing protein [Novosphingobium flavum]|uniref:DUF1592 domain-containing protein n=1 Tax=Novosphingobium aerophilum TaxID=2839843 RepID=A0A7X1F628_9SPHN|nr:DUF1592 domain-containing protein [Novosphingobium aerophilum]MBC2650919.1 DUF1592 domain-containing protein [Novosphingobium aerophilum]MBC2663532.1 DUF1592 domain-containing protein [Novosphingobium aerophilum]
MRLFAKAGPRLRAASVIALATSVAITAFAPSSASPVESQAIAPQASVREPAIAPAEAGLRRLNEVQYARAIEQTFGPGLKIPGRFEPPLREHGLLAIGAAHVTVTPTGLEQYELRGRQIAADAVAGGHVAMPCAPKDGTFSANCARNVLGRYGRMLYRRPLKDGELSSVVALTQAGTQASGSFAKGLAAGLSRLLVSPNFIFRVERNGGPGQIDDWSLATRISFLLWDAPPDEALLDAVARGDLADKARRAAVIERMIASPRFEQGVRAFFFDMFGYEQFQGLVKDQAIYPKFSNDLVKDAQEQTLRTLVSLLIVNKGDYRDIFTTRQTFLNRNLAALYRVPAPTAAMDGWAPFTFPTTEPRAGILSLAAFLMLDPTHEGKSSPTIRGKTVRELLLCQPVPAPPPNVNFSIVQDDSNPLYQTARQRLLAHQESPACAGCHRVTDPIGLSLENYDATGGYRTHEKTALIDASGTFDGKPYSGLLGLTALLRESPDVTSCLVQRVFEYALGREARALDADWLNQANARFSAQGNRVPELMRLIASSDAIAATRPATTATAASSSSPDQAALTSLYRRAR